MVLKELLLILVERARIKRLLVRVQVQESLEEQMKAEVAQPQGRSAAPIADHAREIRRLQREVGYLKLRREILKQP